MTDTLLQLRQINKHFPGVHALKDAQFDVRPGEVHALIGENGAGKSTMIKIVSGVYQPDTGEILLDGQPVEFSNPREAHLAGIATIYQELGLYPELSVAENIFMGHAPMVKRFGLQTVDWERMEAEAVTLLAELNIDDQIQVIDSYITQGVDGILFAANDPVAIAPVLRRALESGVHVVGYDANSEPDAREWFVNQAEFNGIGKALIDSLVDQKGEDASFGIVTSTFTTPNQARWVSEMWAYASECYPDLEWMETLEAQEDAGLSFQQAQTLINKYGEDLDGIIGLTSVATPASADAVNQAGVCEDVAVVGLALPNAMKPYVSTGCVRDVILWNPVDLGYAALYVLRAVVDGEFQPGDATVMAGRLGELTVVNGSEILLGPPFVYNMDNIDDFDF